ncbi:unnamed protein product [Colias eurytheme]|nr:unnamed protein product [Colias eurytheme]
MESLVNNIDLFMVLREKVGSFSDNKKLCEYLKQTLNFNWTEENSATLLKFCRKFCSNISGRWERSHRTFSNFVKRNGDWLESAIIWPKDIIPQEEQNPQNYDTNENLENLAPSQIEPVASTSSSLYSPRKPFEELGDRQKRRRVEQLSKSLSPQELQKSTLQSFKSCGNEELGKIMSHLLSNPEDIEKVKTCLDHKNRDNSYTPEKALALLISLNLSKWQYINLRDSASEQGVHIYPSYHKIKQAKLSCYPSKEDVTITEDGACIKLQALLDLTVYRLLEALEFDLLKKSDLTLICKWGFDGASSQSNYKQKSSETELDDSSVFMASLVPIRLLHGESITWENDRPSSTFYCRPIRFKFMKESEQAVLLEKTDIDNEIEALEPFQLQEVTVKHQLMMTMIDGKITSYISETSAAVCDICKAKSSEMNNLNNLHRRVKHEDMYKYGLSSLHSWIRCMECLLHIAYRLDFKKWSARGEDKNKLAQRKKQIQQAFKEQKGLLVDIVKQGSGTTNDGNTARRFFSDAKTSACITGIDEELIERFHIILQAIASGERNDKAEKSYSSTKSSRPFGANSNGARISNKVTSKPKIVIDYNGAKGAVDMSDQMAAYSTPLRKSIKWYKKYAINLLLNTAVVNALVLYQSVTGKKIQMADFRLELLKSFCSQQDVPVGRPRRMIHKLQQKEGQARTSRRACVNCYKINAATYGRKLAKNKTKKGRAGHAQCSFVPALCPPARKLSSNTSPSRGHR